MLNALTLDIEDYYQVSAFASVIRYNDWERYESRVERNTHRLLELLHEHETKGTFFILGWVAERQPKLVRTISDHGHEIASHGYSHRNVNTQSQGQFREETRKSKRILEDATGQRVIGYRAANWSITAKNIWGLDILREEGFLYDSSIFPAWNGRHGIPDSNRFCHMLNGDGEKKIVEFPLSTLRLAEINIPVAGGGYLRFFPYGFTRWAIRYLNKNEQQPAVVYVHPWEMDLEQPRIKAGAISRFRHYLNLHKTERRVRALLQDFTFGSMSEVLRRRGLLAG